MPFHDVISMAKFSAENSGPALCHTYSTKDVSAESSDCISFCEHAEIKKIDVNNKVRFFMIF
jgi:hypothetical protein